MEIINGNDSKKSTKCSSLLVERNIYIGILLVIVGGVWLLHNFDMLGDRFFEIVFSWQMLCIVVGGYLMACRQWFWGTTVLSVGVIFLLGLLFCIHLPVVKVILPAMLIVLGIALMLQRRC